jgi:hypothetical protein
MTVFKKPLFPLNFLTVVCIGAILFSSCQKTDEKTPDEAKQGKDFYIDSITGERITAGSMQKPLEKAQHIPALKPAELQAFLPETIKGVKSTPPSGGTLSQGQYSWSNAAREYYFPGNVLRISIADFADLDEMVQPRIGNIQSVMKGADENLKPIITNSIVGYEKIDPQTREGKLEVFVANRFYIEITATKLIDNIESLEPVLKSLPLSKLQTVAEQKKN